MVSGRSSATAPTTSCSSIPADSFPTTAFAGATTSSWGIAATVRSRDRIFGIWTSWDLRNTSAATYNQISGGVETFGRVLDAHANWYAVTGPQYSQTSAYILNAPTFSGHNILPAERGELRVGAVRRSISKSAGDCRTWGSTACAATWAAMRSAPIPMATLAAARPGLLARINNNMDVNLQVRTDNAFGTTVVVGGALRWGGLAASISSPNATPSTTAWPIRPSAT